MTKLAAHVQEEARRRMLGGIYQIRNQVNGKRYIGSGLDVRRRWRQHLHDLRHGRHPNQHLQAAFDKYGEETFDFSILEQIDDTSQLIPREQSFLDGLQPEYNILLTAGSCLGHRPSAETCNNMSASWTPARRLARSKAMSGERNSFYGKHHSPEHRRKVSQAQRGRQFSPEHRRKISEAQSGELGNNYGKRLSADTRAKISRALMGHPVSAETRRKLSEARKAYWRRVHATKNQEV